jgi:hypothetical protein
MKRLMLIGAAAFAIATLPTLPAGALPLGSQAPQFGSDAVLVKGGHGHGGRGHMGRGGRGHHYGWSRGRGRGCAPGLRMQGRC